MHPYFILGRLNRCPCFWQSFTILIYKIMRARKKKSLLGAQNCYAHVYKQPYSKNMFWSKYILSFLPLMVLTISFEHNFLLPKHFTLYLSGNTYKCVVNPGLNQAFINVNRKNYTSSSVEQHSAQVPTSTP